MEDFIKQIIEYTALNWVIYNWITFGVYRIPLSIEKYLCPKCISFWITLVLTFNPFLAAVVAFISYLIDKYITTTKTLL